MKAHSFLDMYFEPPKVLDLKCEERAQNLSTFKVWHRKGYSGEIRASPEHLNDFLLKSLAKFHPVFSANSVWLNLVFVLFFWNCKKNISKLFILEKIKTKLSQNREHSPKRYSKLNVYNFWNKPKRYTPSSTFSQSNGGIF